MYTATDDARRAESVCNGKEHTFDKGCLVRLPPQLVFYQSHIVNVRYITSITYHSLVAAVQLAVVSSLRSVWLQL